MGFFSWDFNSELVFIIIKAVINEIQKICLLKNGKSLLQPYLIFDKLLHSGSVVVVC